MKTLMECPIQNVVDLREMNVAHLHFMLRYCAPRRITASIRGRIREIDSVIFQRFEEYQEYQKTRNKAQVAVYEE